MHFENPLILFIFTMCFRTRFEAGCTLARVHLGRVRAISHDLKPYYRRAALAREFILYSKSISRAERFLFAKELYHTDGRYIIMCNINPIRIIINNTVRRCREKEEEWVFAIR